MNGSRTARWLPLSGVLFAVAMVVGFGVAGSSPDSTDPDAKIATYLASDSNFHKNVASLIIIWAASLLLLTFWSTLRSWLSVAEGGTGSLTSLAFGAGVAATVFNLIGVTLFAGPVLAAHDAQQGGATLDPGIFRISQDVGYPVWIMTALIGALAAWSTAAVVWRSRAWGRWYSWVSIVVGIACLFSVVFIPVMVFGLWIIVTSIMLVAKPALTATPTPKPSPSPAASMPAAATT